MMASLRARLVAGLVALAAVGLLLLAGITYAEQRSFQYDRLDQQVRSAPGPLAHALYDDRDRDHGPPGGGPGFGLPQGTYAERRDVNGNVVGSPVIVDYNQNITARPALPKSLPVGKLVTVPGTRGSPRYRVQVTTDPFGGATLVAVPMRDVDQTLHRLLLVEGLVVAGVLLLIGVLAAVVVRIGLLPLDRMGHTAGRIAGGDLSHRVRETDPRTEVGRLGSALNAMLDRLEKAFAERRESEERLRQFIADASHELRTPLASIRGYAELFRIGAARETTDTEKAMRRIEDESQRMGVLVEDLLTLARLDEVREAERTEVDLTALSRDAVDDALVTAPEREVALHANGPVCVLGERDQLRQVLGNLVRNALVHTPPGTPIEVSVDSAGGEARLEVRDHGPGLPTDDPDALFERFWRAEGGRERGKGGAGLGLAIVSGIVEAHGGRVSASNVEDGGASFVVRLPVAPVA
jgi:two-component system OmpR family sensor kinase